MRAPMMLLLRVLLVILKIRVNSVDVAFCKVVVVLLASLIQGAAVAHGNCGTRGAAEVSTGLNLADTLVGQWNVAANANDLSFVPRQKSPAKAHISYIQGQARHQQRVIRLTQFSS